MWNKLRIWIKNNILSIIVFALVIASGIIMYQQSKTIEKWKTKHVDEVNLRNALMDSVTVYKNKNGELVTDKLTIQASLKELKGENVRLNSSQNELIDRIRELDKEKKVITAALIETNLILDSLRTTGGDVYVNTGDSSIIFKDSTEFIKYEFLVENVFPVSPLIDPTFSFVEFKMPNKQFINFNWSDDKELDYPISFSVTNTNPYYKVYDINSYAIPELNKSELNPTGWQKIGRWFKKNGKTVIYVGAGSIIGYGIGSAL